MFMLKMKLWDCSFQAVRNDHASLKFCKPCVHASFSINSRKARVNSVATESAVGEAETKINGGEEPVTVEKYEYQAEVGLLS